MAPLNDEIMINMIAFMIQASLSLQKTYLLITLTIRGTRGHLLTRNESTTPETKALSALPTLWIINIKSRRITCWITTLPMDIPTILLGVAQLKILEVRLRWVSQIQIHMKLLYWFILIALGLLIKWQSHDSTFFYLRIIILDNWMMQLILDISVRYFNTLVGIFMKESDSLASNFF